MPPEVTPVAPDWVKHAVFYQIFPDRFARGEQIVHPAGIRFQPWGTPPEEQGFQGGDLLGIADKLDYLLELGVNALYLNPIFASAANHRYHTFDYFMVDPLLGGNAALRTLLDAAHANDVRVVLDGVFNHASRGFWPFHHVLETGGHSPYVDWFYIRDWPLAPYPSDAKVSHNYDAWWGLPALPKLNVANPGMRAYLLDVARYWIDFGADGWRLDVPDEVDDEAFWQAFRRTVKDANADAYIVGELWGEAQEWLKGDRFDAVMNYIFSRIAFSFFGAETVRTHYRPGGYTLASLDAAEFAQAVEEMLKLYDWEITQVQLNLLDSHDTARALWTLGEDESALRLCVLFQMTMPGTPCIYYGSEIGMTGATDPYCRAAFPWHEPESWNEELLDFHRKAIQLRHNHPVLRTGRVQTLYAAGNVYAMLREDGDDRAIVLFNTQSKPARLSIPDLPPALEGCHFSGAWNKGDYRIQGGKLVDVQIPARDALVLTTR